MNVVLLSSDIMRSIRKTLREVVFSHDFLKCYICSLALSPVHVVPINKIDISRH